MLTISAPLARRQRSRPVEPDVGAPSWPACACLLLCSTTSIAETFGSLPTVRVHTSPWYRYLAAIYHTEHIPLPVELSRFGFFRIPQALAGIPRRASIPGIPWLPVDYCGTPAGGSPNLSAPCPRARCAAEGWLAPTPVMSPGSARRPPLVDCAKRSALFKRFANCDLIPWSWPRHKSARAHCLASPLPELALMCPLPCFYLSSQHPFPQHGTTPATASGLASLFLESRSSGSGCPAPSLSATRGHWRCFSAGPV